MTSPDSTAARISDSASSTSLELTTLPALPAPLAFTARGAPTPALNALATLLLLTALAAVVIGVLWITRKSLDHYLGISVFG